MIDVSRRLAPESSRTTVTSKQDQEQADDDNVDRLEIISNENELREGGGHPDAGLHRGD